MSSVAHENNSDQSRRYRICTIARRGRETVAQAVGYPQCRNELHDWNGHGLSRRVGNVVRDQALRGRLRLPLLGRDRLTRCSGMHIVSILQNLK